jgi:ketosteroid isomerase-like protein
MRQFILFLLATACLMSCNSSGNDAPSAAKTADTVSSVDKTPPAAANSAENLALVNKFFTAVVNHDTAAMSALMADNYMGYGPSIGDSAGKHEYLGNWKYNFDHYFATINYIHSQSIATTIAANNDAEPGDWVSNWAYDSFKYKDGKGPIFIWVNSVFKIENGKISRIRVFYNEADWFRQLGYHLVHPTTGTRL